MALPPAGVTIQQGQAVKVHLDDLRSGSIPFSTLEDAFGPSSLGIIVVEGLPDRFKKLRYEALANSSRLAALGDGELAALESPSSKYLVGWSHGKETLRPGLIDTFKGSYYINCAFYQREQQLHFDPAFPEYTSPNIWPSESALPTFRSSLEDLISLIIDVAVLVARACDTYAVATIQGYETGYLERVVRTSLTTKARLLHYFPEEGGEQNATQQQKEDESIPQEFDDDWCATHKDHGCLTGLTSAMFVDESSSPPSPSVEIAELPTSPDPQAGLYIHSRSGTTTKVNIPKDCLAFQTGETLELITQGKFKAVPHFVRGAKTKKGKTSHSRIARNTLAVFTQPNLGEVVETTGTGLTFGEFARGVVKRNTAEGTNGG